MKGYWGIKVKERDSGARFVWLSPKSTTRLRIHALSFDSQLSAEQYARVLVSDSRNAHIITKVEQFT